MSITLEELVVELKAENQQFMAEMQKSMKVTEEASKQMRDDFKKFSDESSKSANSFRKVWQTAVGFVTGQAMIAAFNGVRNAAVSFFRTLVTDGVEAAQVQENAENRLAQALARTGKFTREANEDFKAYASSLQSVSKFGDELILENAALIQSLGKLSVDGLKEATASALDLAAGLNIDLRSASNMIGRAAAGNTAIFNRFGITVEEGANKSETFANALRQINQQFGGAAQAELETYDGKTTQLSNSFGDMTEQIGFAITNNTALLEAIGEVRVIIDELTNSLDENQDMLQAFVSQGILLAVETIPVLVSTIGYLIEAFAWWRTTLAELALWEAKYTLAVGKNARERRRERIEELEEAADLAAKQQAQMRIAVRDAEDLANVIRDRVSAAVGRGAEKQEEYNARLEELALRNAKAQQTTKELSEEEIKRGEMAHAILQRLEEAEHAHRLQSIEGLEEHLEHEQQILSDARNKNLMTEQEYYRAKVMLEEEHSQKKQEMMDREAQQQEYYNQLRISQTADLFSALGSLSAQGGRKNFQQTKSLNLVAAKMEGFLAVQRAMAAPPGWPWNSIGVAAAGVRSFANIRAIQGQSPPALRRGIDSVPGIGFQDNFPAILAPQERVVPRETNKELNRFLRDQKPGSPTGQTQNVHVVLEMRDQLMDFIDARIVERERLSTKAR